jgi:hypothetical protein
MVRTYPDCSAEIDTVNVLYDYIHGGQGIIKLEAPSGVSHQYGFFKPDDASEFPDDILFVYAIHDSTRKFYLGMLEDDKFRLTKHSKFLPDTPIVKGAEYLCRIMNNPMQFEHRKMKIYHMGMCARCGRKLTDQKRLKLGFGRKCLRYYMAAAMKDTASELMLPDYVVTE